MNKATYSFEDIVEIMRRLRGPGGCPWDAEQTHQSLKRYLLEETYEVMEAIDSNNSEHLKEELGDLMLQPVFHSAIAEESGAFDINDIMTTLAQKLIRRHPHVFGNEQISDSQAQIENWEKIKKEEKGEERRSALAGIPPDLPALMKARKITEKASRVGFDWEHVDQVMSKVMEELHEFEEALTSGDQEQMEAELGDLLFAIVNLGRFIDIDAEQALRKTISRFQTRFNFIEEKLHSEGKHIQDTSLEELDRIWDQAKSAEKEGNASQYPQGLVKYQ